MKPPSVEHKVNDGARGARTDVSEKVWCVGKNYGADTIAETQEPVDRAGTGTDGGISETRGTP